MATATAEEQTLAAYESVQVAKIAAWKASHPNAFGELFRRVTQPLAHIVEMVIPDRFALVAIEAAYKASELSATAADVEVQAGVPDLGDLRHKPLEVCDGLAQRVGTVAQMVGAVEGAVTGAGGIWTTVLDIPLLFGLCLRTIIKIGHCYGYPLDRPTDKAWVLGAFAVALSGSKEKRTDMIARLRDVEDLVLEETQEQVVTEELAALVTQIEIFEEIPVFAAATGALLNLAVVHRTASSARRLFQERWLRDNGKVEVIAPAGGAEEPSSHGWRGAVARAGYATVYGVSFSAVFPIRLAGGMLGPIARPVAARLQRNRRSGDTGASTRDTTNHREIRASPVALAPV